MGKIGQLSRVVAGFLLVAAVSPAGASPLASFGNELSFLQKNTDVVVLSNKDGQCQVVVSPTLQGRVLTSTAGGLKGSSFGWINHDLIPSKKTLPHINPYGGEDRFWLGPEGGQFSVFFKPGSKFVFDDWQVPTAMDTESFNLEGKTADSVALSKTIDLTNYSGTRFQVGVERTIRLLSNEDAWKDLGLEPASGVQMVAYESENKITNDGKKSWTKKTGLLSIWILGMYNPSDHTTVVIPFNKGSEADLGPMVHDTYFGKVPADRLVAGDGVLYFKGDGKLRSKIGVPPKRVRPVLGSYDADHQVLTIIQFTKPEDAVDYVNSLWELQKDPFAGDVANSYNDGPAEPGKKPLGPFYELESSSPAAALKPGKSLTHVHRTMHLEGPEKSLDPVAKSLLGVGLEEIKSALK